jgi:hypothetical protein
MGIAKYVLPIYWHAIAGLAQNANKRLTYHSLTYADFYENEYDLNQCTHTQKSKEQTRGIGQCACGVLCIESFTCNAFIST